MSGMKVELEYSELEERFRTRLLYASASEVGEFKAELDDAASIAASWKKLIDDADLVDASLEDTKKQFSQTTRQQVFPEHPHAHSIASGTWLTFS
jgi:dynein heavy chain